MNSRAESFDAFLERAVSPRSLPESGTSHELTFVLQNPIDVPKDGPLIVVLDSGFTTTASPIARFRVFFCGVTTQPNEMSKVICKLW